MIGTLVNVAAVIVGSLIGLLLRKGFPEKMKSTVTTGMGLCTMIIGIQNFSTAPRRYVCASA